jgi:NhaA family Na+:H+ antiporter
VLWYTVRHSGVHATLAGILLALVIPAEGGMSTESFLERGRMRIEEIAKSALRNRSNREARKHLYRMRSGMNRYEPPLDRLQRNLHPWVSFGIVPLFAFTNAGISLDSIHPKTIFDPVFLGVLLGLLFGKPLGIFFFSWMAVRSHLAMLPRGVSWAQLHGVSWLGGIGFTISIFISGLAFQRSDEDATARIAIFCASTLAAIIGVTLLKGRANRMDRDSA